MYVVHVCSTCMYYVYTCKYVHVCMFKCHACTCMYMYNV